MRSPNAAAPEQQLGPACNEKAAVPGRLQPVTPELMKKMQRLSAGIEVDLDEEIEGPVSL